tara:strand:+ start:1004 stop:1192 length:189 start_codon:yes stop_codon:yes gene_type:complete
MEFNIKKIRIKMRITQYQMAEKLGISWRYLQQLEKGDRRPSWNTIESISKKLDISVHDLIDD